MRHHDEETTGKTISQLKNFLAKNESAKGVKSGPSRVLCYLLRQWLKYRQLGYTSTNPSVPKISTATFISDRTVQRTLRGFERLGILIVVGDKKGGNVATKYTFDILALMKWLETLPTKPSRLLLERLKTMQDRFGNAHLRGDKVSYGYKSNNYCYSSSLSYLPSSSTNNASNNKPHFSASSSGLCLEDQTSADPFDDPNYLASQQETANWEPIKSCQHGTLPPTPSDNVVQFPALKRASV